MIQRNRWPHLASAVVFALSAISGVSAAQSGSRGTINPSFETRAQLETQARTAGARRLAARLGLLYGERDRDLERALACLSALNICPDTDRADDPPVLRAVPIVPSTGYFRLNPGQIARLSAL